MGRELAPFRLIYVHPKGRSSTPSWMVVSSVEKIVGPTSETLRTISALTDDNDQFVVVAT